VRISRVVRESRGVDWALPHDVGEVPVRYELARTPIVPENVDQGRRTSEIVTNPVVRRFVGEWVRAELAQLTGALAEDGRRTAHYLLSESAFICLAMLATDLGGYEDVPSDAGNDVAMLWGVQARRWPVTEDRPERMGFDLWVAASDGTDDGTLATVRHVRYQEIMGSRTRGARALAAERSLRIGDWAEGRGPVSVWTQ